jgi:hypothetical protein
MKYPKIKIDLSRYKWVIDRTDVDEKLIYKKFPKLDEWISGIDQPTMKQLCDFSSLTHIPLGYFFLETPPTETIELLKYKTIQSDNNSSASRNLLDTIRHMENIQDVMRDYYIDYEVNENTFVASLKNDTKIESMADIIRQNI